MKAKKYLCLATAVSISVCTVVFGRIRFDDSIDALTRPSPESALILLYGIKSISVDLEIRVNGSYYSDYNRILSHKYLFTEVTKQLKEETNVVLLKSDVAADGCIWADIQLTTREETEFVAANISVSFVERMPLKRIPPRVVSDFRFYGTTWQSRATLLVHKDKLSEEIPKCLRLLVHRFCLIFYGKQMYEETQPKKHKDEQNNK
jgi:hypothetical protein